MVLDTGSGEEIASMAVALREAPDWSAGIRRKGRELAALFTWDNSIEIMLKKLPLMAIRQGVEPRTAG